MGGRILFVCLLLTVVTCSPTREERKAKREREANSACTREICAKARSTLKINADCLRAPFCVR